MSKTQTTHYVAKCNFGTYYNGMGQFTDQIRQAKMYNSVKAAVDNFYSNQSKRCNLILIRLSLVDFLNCR